MSTKNFILVLCTVFVFSDAAFVDTLNKCGKNDKECFKNMFQRYLKETSKTGIPELDLPPFDPVVLKDISVPVLNIVDLQMVDGVVKGMKNCVVNTFEGSVEKGRNTLELTCDLLLKGHYKAFSNSPLVQSVFGAESVRGDGNAKVKIEKLNMKFDYNFFVEKRDGDTYFKFKEDKLNYKYDVLGKVVFAADHLYLGDRDASEQITNMLNQNWRLILRTVGDSLMERTLERIKVFLRNFYDRVPTKYFITDDLTPYAKTTA